MKTPRMIWMSAPVLLAWAGMVFAGEQPVQPTEDKTAHSGPVQSVVSRTNISSVPNYPVIGYLEGRGRTITIKAGPKGTLYSVKTADGKVLCENLSAEQLRAQAPELHELIKTGIAGASGKGGAVLDARVDARN